MKKQLHKLYKVMTKRFVICARILGQRKEFSAGDVFECIANPLLARAVKDNDLEIVKAAKDKKEEDKQ